MIVAGDLTYVALFRGINVGGRNTVRMASLRSMFEEVGCTDVQTYIQSGNVVFRASKEVARGLPGRIRSKLIDETGVDVPVVLRTASAFRDAVHGNPFLERGAEPSGLHIMFLADDPQSADVAKMDPNRSPPDEFDVRGRHVYLHCPNGVGRTKLTNAYVDSRLNTTSTSRNWRTVHKLLEMIDR